MIKGWAIMCLNVPLYFSILLSLMSEDFNYLLHVNGINMIVSLFKVYMK